MRLDLFALTLIAAIPLVAYLAWRVGFATGRRHELLAIEHRAKIAERRRREQGRP